MPFGPGEKRSQSGHETRLDGSDLTFALEVKGIGVMLIRTSSELEDLSGTLTPEGMSLFTLDEVGYSPRLSV